MPTRPPSSGLGKRNKSFSMFISFVLMLFGVFIVTIFLISMNNLEKENERRVKLQKDICADVVSLVNTLEIKEKVIDNERYDSLIKKACEESK